MPTSMIKTILEYCSLVAGDNKLRESLFDMVLVDVDFVDVCISVTMYSV